MVYTKVFQRCKGYLSFLIIVFINPLTAGAAYIRVFILY